MALEAIRGEPMLAGLAAKHGLHQTMIAAWKKQVVDALATTFSGKAENISAARKTELTKLHAKIGQLVVERDFFVECVRSMSVDRRRLMIEPAHPHLSIVWPCALVSISRSAFHYAPTGEMLLTLALKRLIDEQFLETPIHGARQVARYLRRQGYVVGSNRTSRLMARMGLAAIYQKPRTRDPYPAHRTKRYLLRHVTINRPNQVWCADITDIPTRRGFLSTSSRSWTARRASCWPRGWRTRWMPNSASTRWRKRRPGSARRKSSTPINARNLPARTSPTC